MLLMAASAIAAPTVNATKPRERVRALEFCFTPIPPFVQLKWIRTADCNNRTAHPS
jgi:hypothetical protein